MKELIYRRATSGYEVYRCAEGVSAANRQAGKLHGMSCMKDLEEGIIAAARQQDSEKSKQMMEKIKNAVIYRQFRLDDGSIVLGIGYKDPNGSRNSLMGHVLYVENDEIGKVLDSYPSRSTYFNRFRAEFEKNEELHQASEEMEISVENYLSGCRCGLAGAFELLKKVFQTTDNLAGVFEALLDSASENAKMVVLFGPEEAHDVMAERGRAIIEALFACLPNVLTRHLGYISPCNSDAGNAMFGIRYSKMRAIDSKLRNYAYTYDLQAQKLIQPPKASHAAAEYADELAKMVFRGDETALKRIGALKSLLDDEGLYNAADVPADLALRYRFYNNANLLSAQDKKTLLDWHHSVIDAAEKKKDASLLDHSKFWAVVDRWILSNAINDIYANSHAWKDNDPVYSQRRIAEIYGDGQKLFLMQRGEAKEYLGYFANRIGVQPLLDANSEQRVTGELVKFMLEQVRKATDINFASRTLYWNPIERWLNGRWCDGMLINDRGMFEAVKRLYDLDAGLANGYIQAYADHVRRHELRLLELVRTNFGRAVYQTILVQTPDYVADSMHRELDKQNLFGVPTEPEVVAKFSQYREMVKTNEGLVQCFNSICDARLSYTMRQAQAEHLPQLFAELEADEESPCMINTCKRLNPGRDARSIIENRIVELTRLEGVYPLYPGKMKLARDVAALLDRKGAQGMWAQRLKVLEKAHTLLLNDMTDEEFDHLMEYGFGTGNDRMLMDRVKQLLWQNVERTFSEGNPDLKKLVMALALCSGGGGFSPAAILKDIERFDIAPKKLFSFCKKMSKGAGERGIGYVASEVLDLEGNENGRWDDWSQYPGTIYREEAPVKKASSGMFAGIPMVAAAISVVVFGAGFAAGVIGVLSRIGLM